MVPKPHRKVKRRHLCSSSSSTVEESQDEDLLDGPRSFRSITTSHTHTLNTTRSGVSLCVIGVRGSSNLGEDPLTYDFETEWKVYWKHRLSKLEVEDWNEKKKKYLGLVKKGHGVSDRRRKYESWSTTRTSSPRSSTESSSRSSTTSSTVSTGTSSSSSRTKSRSPSSSSSTRSRSTFNLKERARRLGGRSCSRLRLESRKKSQELNF
ncbi:putative uncharacterized protein DDB_G0281733 [Penaeus chinensis]|uniref:putative uncharacterized protein DDB_G0281733 n=1 Tax=Penaeus chinensis TaxID=139456 RepID=UPI001FB852E9|nr:putative uncharacterized protein DDB_G0281733 [Penaeus chinensis]